MPAAWNGDLAGRYLFISMGFLSTAEHICSAALGTSIEMGAGSPARSPFPVVLLVQTRPGMEVMWWEYLFKD